MYVLTSHSAEQLDSRGTAWPACPRVTVTMLPELRDCLMRIGALVDDGICARKHRRKSRVKGRVVMRRNAVVADARCLHTMITLARGLPRV